MLPDKKNVCIKCTKCGYESRVAGGLCAKCGSPLAKICGGCGFGNSVTKNYCDSCGELLTLSSDETPAGEKCAGGRDKIQFQAIEDTVFPDPEAPACTRKPAKEESGHFNHVPGPVPQSGSEQKEKNLVTGIRTGKKWLTIGIYSMAALFCLELYLLIAPKIPEYQLIFTAEKYLGELKAGRYEKAYKMLSKISRASCPLEDFIDSSRQYYDSAPQWKFRNIKALSVEKEAALIRYEIQEGSHPWKDDYISFVREDGKWARPYIWALINEIEQTLAKNDYTEALMLAQRIYLTDPFDPRANGYLCSTEYNLQLFEKSAASCAKTLSRAQLFPVGFDNETVTGYRFYYADSLKNTGKYKAAADEFTRILSYGGISPEAGCFILHAKADAEVSLENYDSALRDILEAQNVCKNQMLETIKQKLTFLNGDARSDAIELAQSAKRSQDQPNLLELRKQQILKMAQLLKSSKKALMPRDTWTAIHMHGPVYQVILKQEGGKNTDGSKLAPQDIYRLKINTWTNTVSSWKD